MGKGRNGGLWLTLITSNFLPLIDNALTQGKMKCWKADTGGGVQSSGGSQTSLTSLPFFFCQVFIKRKCTDIKNPKLKGTFFLHRFASRTLSVSFKSLTSSLSWSKLLWDCPLGQSGKPLIWRNSKGAALRGVGKPGWGLWSYRDHCCGKNPKLLLPPIEMPSRFYFLYMSMPPSLQVQSICFITKS